MNEESQQKLVSVIIITYNSSKYIIETLESIKLQTYGSLELIISDDNSSDETLSLCEEWLKTNASRFQRFEIIAVKSNSGVAGNCNRGVSAAHGKWLKLCAGDDLLLEGCISDNIKFVTENPKTKMVVSNSIVFLDNTEPKKIVDILKPLHQNLLKESVSAQEQYNALLISYIESTTSFFLSKSVFDSVKFDENFPFLEDYPFALNATKAGFKFVYLDKDTVLYRLRQDSISKSYNTVLYNEFFRKIRKFDKIYRHPFLDVKRVKKENYEYQRKELLCRYNLNRNNFLCRLINTFTIYTNPYRF